MGIVSGVSGCNQGCINNITKQLFKENVYKNIFLTMITFGLYYHFVLHRTAELLVGQVEDLRSLLSDIEEVQEKGPPPSVNSRKEAVDFIVQEIRKKNKSKHLDVSKLNNVFFHHLMKMKGIHVPDLLAHCQMADRFIKDGSMGCIKETDIEEGSSHNNVVRSEKFVDLIVEILKIKNEFTGKVDLQKAVLSKLIAGKQWGKIYSVKDLEAVMELVFGREEKWTPDFTQKISVLLEKKSQCPKKTWDEVMLPWDVELKNAFFPVFIEQAFNALNKKMKENDIFLPVYEELKEHKNKDIWYGVPLLSSSEKIRDYPLYDSIKRKGVIPLSYTMLQDAHRFAHLVLVDSQGKETKVAGVEVMEKRLILMNWLAREGGKEETDDLIQNLQETLVQTFLLGMLEKILHCVWKEDSRWEIGQWGFDQKNFLFRMGEGLFSQRIDVEMGAIISDKINNNNETFSKCLSTSWYVDHVKNPTTGVWEIKNIRSDPIKISFD